MLLLDLESLPGAKDSDSRKHRVLPWFLPFPTPSLSTVVTAPGPRPPGLLAPRPPHPDQGCTAAPLVL